MFQNSHFSNFLSRVIYVTNENINESNVKANQKFTERLQFSYQNDKNNDQQFFSKLSLSNTIIIDKCRFEYINSKQNEGGCIYAETHLAITESTFSMCSSKNGCIYCNNSYLALFSTTFNSCNSQHMSSCFTQYYYMPKNNIPTIISSTNFFDCKSYNLFGVFYISSPNPVSMTNSNITECGASQCVGSFEISNSALFIKYTQFLRSYARVHNGCIVLRNAGQFQIESTTFIECQQTTTLSETGCDLLLYNIPADSLIKDTAFLDSRPSKGFSITAVGGIELSFEDCVFSFPKNVEINPSSSYLCVFSNTIFECSDDNKDKNDQLEDVQNLKKKQQCTSMKIKISNQIQKSNSISKIKQKIDNNKYNNKYLQILFEYNQNFSSSFTISKSNSSRVSNFADKIAEKDFFVNHQIRKKHIIFFFIYTVFLIFGFLFVLAFELLIRKYPLLCVIKPNKGGFMQAKTPHAIL